MQLEHRGALARLLAKFAAQEDLNFLLTNRIPRATLTRFIGWFSKIEQPLVRDFSIALWKQFCDIDLGEAKKTRFTSMHDCFIRELKPGMRTVDMDLQAIASPSDAIVGACGQVVDGQVFQAKDFPYRIEDLMVDEESIAACRNGTYVTLRLTAGMYHRFHAPADLEVEQVDYISGDTWNVNPIALKRVERLFCRNERAAIRTRLTHTGQVLTLVPVAAVLVASIRLHFIDVLLHIRYKGPNRMACDSVPYVKGQEMGWFEHGSTIIVFAPAGFTLAPGIAEGRQIRMGQALLRLPGSV
ncbi:MAG TPA: archaetidylserine decarboxylase [Burkholderiales bacterium]|jgi:phosphatidylserine decarboxylase